MKSRYFKSFNVYACNDCDGYYLKLVCTVNDCSSSLNIEVSKFDYDRILKILNVYNENVKEILQNGK